MTVWYKTILGIAAALSLLIGILVLLANYCAPALEFGSVPFVEAFSFGIIYLIFYFIIYRIIFKKYLKIIFSIIILFFPFFLYATFFYPDKSLSKQIVYVLPENFRGRFTINFKLSKRGSDAVFFNDSAVIYYIPKDGIFNSSYPFIEDYGTPDCYIQDNYKLVKMNFVDWFGPTTKDSSLIFFYSSEGYTSFFESINYQSYIVDYSYNICKYEEFDHLCGRVSNNSENLFVPRDSTK